MTSEEYNIAQAIGSLNRIRSELESIYPYLLNDEHKSKILEFNQGINAIILDLHDSVDVDENNG